MALLCSLVAAGCLDPRPVLPTRASPPPPPPGIQSDSVVRYKNRRGAGRVIPVVVRPVKQPSIVVVLSFNTYQAYNSWGGASLYLLPDGTAQAPMVSFLRPYTDYTLQRHFVVTDLPLVSF